METADAASSGAGGAWVDAGRRGRKHLWLIPVVGAVLGVAWVMYDGMSRARERARRGKCCSNLKSLGYALHLYAGDYEERGSPLPPDLGFLYPDYVSDGEVFLCPSAGKAIALQDDPDFSVHLARGVVKGYRPAMFGDTHTDYVYVSGLRADDPPDYVVAFDDELNHGGDGVYALHIGGQVAWFTDIDGLHERLARQERGLAAQGRKMKLIRPAWSSRGAFLARDP